jgi:Spy/CpxP family protein refolding chaperone
MLRRAVLVSTIALALSAAAAVAQSAPPAQGPGGPGQGPGGFAQRRMQMMMQGITLTPAQQARVDSITTRMQAQMPAFTPGTPPSPEDRQHRRQVMMQQDSMIRAVLTPEQQQAWDHNAEQMRQNAPQRPGGR